MAKQEAYYAPGSLDYAANHGGVTPAQIVQSAYYAEQVGPGNWACGGSQCVNTVTGATQSVSPSPVVAPIPQTYAQFLAPAATALQQQPPAATVYSPRVVFTSQRGGSTLYPGDTWSIVLTGAAPGAEIYVTGGKNGAQDRQLMGKADSTGRFALAGTANSSELGTWVEAWDAGGVNAGSFTFTIAAGPGGTTAGETAAGPVGGGTMTPPGFNLGWFSESMIGGIPNWILVAGGAVGAVVLMGGKK